MNDRIIDQYIPHYSKLFIFDDIDIERSEPGSESSESSESMNTPAFRFPESMNISMVLIPRLDHNRHPLHNENDLINGCSYLCYHRGHRLQLTKIFLKYITSESANYHTCRYTRTVFTILTGRVRMIYHRRCLTPLNRVKAVRTDLGPRAMIKSGITEMVSPAVMVIEPYTYYRFLSGTSCLLIVTFWGHHGDQEGPNEVTVNEEHLMKLIIPPSPPTVDKQSDA